MSWVLGATLWATESVTIVMLVEWSFLDVGLSYSRWPRNCTFCDESRHANYPRCTMLMPSEHHQTIHYLQDQISKVQLDIKSTKAEATKSHANVKPRLDALYAVIQTLWSQICDLTHLAIHSETRCTIDDMHVHKVPLILLCLLCSGFDVVSRTVRRRNN